MRRQFLDTLRAYINGLVNEEKYATAQIAWAIVTSLLIHRGALVSGTIFEVKYPENELLPPQHIPREEEYESMLRHAGSARNRFALAFFRFGGGRLGVIEDPEPIKISNILDLDLDTLDKDELKFTNASSCAILLYGVVRSGEVKRYRETYVSFIPPQAMDLLKEYFEERLRSGEKLNGDSYLFIPDRTEHSERRSKAAKPYVRVERMQGAVAAASKRAGFMIKDHSQTKAKFTTHSLRRLFYNSLQGLEDVDKECLTGHVKGVRARYHGSVDETDRAVEFMRQKYELGMRTYITTGSAEEQRKKALLDFARMQGMQEEDINTIQNALHKKFGHMVTIDNLREALQEHISAKKKQEPVNKATMTDGGKAYNALLVTDDNLVEYLETGWEIVKELSNGQIAIRRPSS